MMKRSQLDLGVRGRIAIVTGSSQGIGRAAAILLGREGARVAVTYHDQRDKADTVVDEIARAGSEALAIRLDLASDESIHAAIRAVLERWSRIDILVNNAVQHGDRNAMQRPAPAAASISESAVAASASAASVITVMKALRH